MVVFCLLLGALYVRFELVPLAFSGVFFKSESTNVSMSVPPLGQGSRVAALAALFQTPNSTSPPALHSRRSPTYRVTACSSSEVPHPQPPKSSSSSASSPSSSSNSSSASSSSSSSSSFLPPVLKPVGTSLANVVRTRTPRAAVADAVTGSKTNPNTVPSAQTLASTHSTVASSRAATCSPPSPAHAPANLTDTLSSTRTTSPTTTVTSAHAATAASPSASSSAAAPLRSTGCVDTGSGDLNSVISHSDVRGPSQHPSSLVSSGDRSPSPRLLSTTPRSHCRVPDGSGLSSAQGLSAVSAVSTAGTRHSPVGQIDAEGVSACASGPAAATVTSLSSCSIMGFLTKMGGAKGGRKSWKRRWVVLRNDCIYYYRSKEQMVELGVMPLHGVRVLDVPQATSSSPAWEQSSSCFVCLRDFSLLLRKHHCRSCWRTLCDSCSSRSIPVPQFAFWAPVRVCNACYSQQLSLLRGWRLRRPRKEETGLRFSAMFCPVVNDSTTSSESSLVAPFFAAEHTAAPPAVLTDSSARDSPSEERTEEVIMGVLEPPEISVQENLFSSSPTASPPPPPRSPSDREDEVDEKEDEVAELVKPSWPLCMSRWTRAREDWERERETHHRSTAEEGLLCAPPATATGRELLKERGDETVWFTSPSVHRLHLFAVRTVDRELWLQVRCMVLFVCVLCVRVFYIRVYYICILLYNFAYHKIYAYYYMYTYKYIYMFVRVCVCWTNSYRRTKYKKHRPTMPKLATSGFAA